MAEGWQETALEGLEKLKKSVLVAIAVSVLFVIVWITVIFVAVSAGSLGPLIAGVVVFMLFAYPAWLAAKAYETLYSAFERDSYRWAQLLSMASVGLSIAIPVILSALIVTAQWVFSADK